MNSLAKIVILLSILYPYSTLSFIVEDTSITSIVNQDGVDCKQYPDGHKIASPTDCSEYYVCFRDVAYLFQCPNTTSGQLQFNSELNVCDWAWRVDCKVTTTIPSTTTTKSTTDSSISDSTTVKTTISTTQETSIPQNFTSTQQPRVKNDIECPHGSNGKKFASPTSCSEYYVCFMGIPYLFMCPNTTTGQLYFDPDLEVCNWPWQVDCEITSTSTDRPTTTSRNITTTEVTSQPPVTTTPYQNSSSSTTQTSMKPMNTTTPSNDFNRTTLSTT